MMLDERVPPAEPSQIISDLRRERDEALAREAAISEVLQIINSSPGDLAAVFQAMLDRAVRLCEATHGTLRTFNGETFHLVATAHGEALVLPDAGRGPSSLYRRFSDGEQIIHLADVLDSPEYQLNPGVRAGMDAVRARSWLGVSLRKEARLLGVIAILRQELRPFSDEQIALLKNFAAQAAIAMENARLITETREALEQQTATAEVLQVINSSPGDLAPVFDAILERAHALCGAASGGLMVIEGNRYRAVAVHGDAGLAEYWRDLGWIPFPTGENTLFGRLSRGEIVHYRDATLDDGTLKSDQYHRLVELAGARSLVAVPLRKDEVLFGTITAFRKEAEPFSEKQIALLQNFAAQAVIAMENARLITETREALEQQTATAEVLQVINSSPGDFAPVFEAILEKAHTVCGVTSGGLLIREGDAFRVVAAHGDSPYTATRLEQGFFRPPEGSPLWRLLHGAQLIHLADARDDDSYRNAPGYARIIDTGGIRTLLQMPLCKDGELLGAITAFRQEVRPFTDKQIALLQNFAAQAVIAMENARLLTETREALEQQTATAEVLGVINSSPGDLAPVFEAILERAHALCAAEFGALAMFDGDKFRALATHGIPEAVAVAMRQPFRHHPDNPMMWLARGDRLAHVPDLAEFAANASAEDVMIRNSVDLVGIRTWLAIPLRKDGTLMGAISAFRREVRPFSDKEIALLENFAAQAVIAMENARLITETREALEQQTATAEVLQVINASPGDLAPVFDAMLEKAVRLCDSAFGMMFTWDGECIHRVAWHGISAEQIEAMRQSLAPAPGTPGYRIARGENVVCITDLAEEAAAPPTLVQLGGRSYALVALRHDGKLLGGITTYRREVRPFTDKEIALLQNFAAQAVIAMENARLLTETREALEQQTATAEVLGVINSSPGDLPPVFNAMVERAVRLCEADAATVRTFDGELLHLAAAHAEPRMMEELRLLGPSHLNWLYEPLSRGERVIHIPDVRETAAYREIPGAQDRLDRRGIRSWLAVALCKDGALLGILNVHRREVRPFSDTQIALLENFAAQAVIAMENARLLAETREALEQQTATAEVLQVINSSPGDLKPVFDAMLERATRLSEADFGTLWTFDGDRFRPAVGRGHGAAGPNTIPEGVRPAPGVPLGRLIAGENVVHVVDVATEDAFQSDPVLRSRTAALGTRSALAVALRKDDVLLGAITASRKRVEPYSDKQIALLQNFAAQAVIAMENARLLTETREALEQQTATSEVLGVINSSPGELAPVFDAMLEKATSLCEAAHGNLWTYDGERFYPVATHGSPRFSEWLRQHGPVEPPPGSIFERLARGEDFVQIADAVIHNLTSSFSREVTEITGARTVLAVPLRKDNALRGAIFAYRQEVRPFSDKQIALFQNFAAQAVIAMENARLLSELHNRTDEVAELNRGLEARVAEQVEELGRVGRLKRFLAPQLAELIVSQGDEKILESHRREIVVVFCDLRGYTAFTETAEPEEVLDFLREYHGALGPLVSQYEGTLDQFSGDGIMVFFNDPVPIPDPAERAVRMAMAMREAARALIAAWRRRGRLLGFGAGIAQGYATLGQIGFADRSGYTAIGTVCNLAARLCAEAKDGQILVGQRVAVAVEETIPLEELGELSLKGLTQPVVAFNVPTSEAGFDAAPPAGTA
jgi:GAF domain-containing protein